MKFYDFVSSGASLSAEKWLTGNCEPLFNFSVTDTGGASPLA